MNRRQLFLSCLVAAGWSLAAAVPAQGLYPERPIRIVVPFTPGGANDVLARLVAPPLQARLGQPVVVDNKPGAGGHIGGDFVAKSPADGYTLLLTQNGQTIAPWLEKNLSYDPMSMAPVTIATTLPILAAVNISLPVTSFNELIAYARANPGKLSYATPGNGTPQHLGTELLLNMTGTQMVMVSYKGNAGMLPDLIAGRVNLLLNGVMSVLPLAQSGKVRLIGVAERKRLAALPDLPTIMESLPDYQINFWFGFMAPSGTPEALTHKLADEFRAILRIADISERLRKGGFEIAATTPEEMRAIMRSDYEKWGKVVKTAGIKAE